MALPGSGTISLGDIAGEFGGTVPHALTEYYGAAPGVPASGVISASDFYGTSAVVPSTFKTFSSFNNFFPGVASVNLGVNMDIGDYVLIVKICNRSTLPTVGGLTNNTVHASGSYLNIDWEISSGVYAGNNPLPVTGAVFQTQEAQAVYAFVFTPSGQYADSVVFNVAPSNIVGSKTIFSNGLSSTATNWLNVKALMTNNVNNLGYNVNVLNPPANFTPLSEGPIYADRPGTTFPAVFVAGAGLIYYRNISAAFLSPGSQFVQSQVNSILEDGGISLTIAVV